MHTCLAWCCLGGWYRYTYSIHRETPLIYGPYRTRRSAIGPVAHLNIFGLTHEICFHWRRPQDAATPIHILSR